MGNVFMAGGNLAMKAPSTGIPAGELAVGSSVYLMVNGTATEFLVVNQGVPSGSNLYDASCDGTWLLMKDLYTKMSWDSSNNDYGNSDTHAYLNGDFLALLGESEQNAIKEVKIPYQKGTGSGGSIASGSNGLSTKAFLLSGYEAGWTTNSYTYFPIDGACLDYFNGTSKTDSKRIGYYDGTATYWWLRSPRTDTTTAVRYVNTSGGASSQTESGSCGIRPALILPSDTLFDPETLHLKGVS